VGIPHEVISASRLYVINWNICYQKQVRTFQIPLPDTAEPAFLVEPFYNPFNKIDMSMDSGNGWAIVSPLWSPVKYNT